MRQPIRERLKAKRTEAQRERFDRSVEARNFEIDLLWRRSTFFWLFIAAAFTGFGLAVDAEVRPVAALLAGFGLFASGCWSLLNRGSRFWFLVWEGRTEVSEREVFDRPLFGAPPQPNLTPGWLEARRFSVSRITIAISDYVTLIWVFTFVLQVADAVRSDDWFAAIFASLIGTMTGFFVLSVANATLPVDDRPILTRAAVRRWLSRSERG